MKYSIFASAFFFLGLAASQSTTYPPFDTATTDPFPQHPPSMTDPRGTASSTVDAKTTSSTIVAKTTSATGQRETSSTTSASTFTVVTETSSGTSSPTSSTKPNDASMAKAGAALIIPGIAGLVAGILV